MPPEDVNFTFKTTVVTGDMHYSLTHKSRYTVCCIVYAGQVAVLQLCVEWQFCVVREGSR